MLFDAQGEDVVAGTHATEPIAALDERTAGGGGRAPRRAPSDLERHYRDLCDIEFTIEDGRLWLLQVRVGQSAARRQRSGSPSIWLRTRRSRSRRPRPSSASARCSSIRRASR
jgi:hypothetical protein